MSLNLFFNGLLIGFSIAAPVGPIGVLCIRRTLAFGRGVGFATGLGAATGDALYGCIAGLGLTAISSFLVEHRFWLAMLGGLFLCYLGIRTFAAHPVEAEKAPSRSTVPLLAYLTALALTVTNPATILSFVAVFAGFGLIENPSYLNAAQLVTGVFFGSAAWWLILSGMAGFLRPSADGFWMRAINRISSSVIFGFGLYSLLSQVL